MNYAMGKRSIASGARASRNTPQTGPTVAFYDLQSEICLLLLISSTGTILRRPPTRRRKYTGIHRYTYFRHFRGRCLQEKPDDTRYRYINILHRNKTRSKGSVGKLNKDTSSQLYAVIGNCGLGNVQDSRSMSGPGRRWKRSRWNLCMGGFRSTWVSGWE